MNKIAEMRQSGNPNLTIQTPFHPHQVSSASNPGLRLEEEKLRIKSKKIIEVSRIWVYNGCNNATR